MLSRRKSIGKIEPVVIAEVLQILAGIAGFSFRESVKMKLY